MREPPFTGRSREPAVAAVVEALASRPDEAAADFVEFLDRSWREWFSAEWATIRPVLAGRARVFADTVSAQGAATALATLDPSITVTGPGSISIAKVQNARHDVSRRGLLVAPSGLIWPHLYVANVPRYPLLLIHPAEAGPSVPSVTDLLQRLGTVAHRGRWTLMLSRHWEPTCWRCCCAEPTDGFCQPARRSRPGDG
jgi:hypothetical protein